MVDKIIMIGQWNRKKFQYLSHRQKRQYLRDWRSGKIQQRQLSVIFGKPEANAPLLTDLLRLQEQEKVWIVRALDKHSTVKENSNASDT